jgi:hypothetical protein
MSFAILSFDKEQPSKSSCVAGGKHCTALLLISPFEFFALSGGRWLFSRQLFAETVS